MTEVVRFVIESLPIVAWWVFVISVIFVFGVPVALMFVMHISRAITWGVLTACAEFEKKKKKEGESDVRQVP